MPFPPKADPIKHCEICGIEMLRKRYGKRLEDRNVFLKRRRCSQVCANSKLEVQTNTYRNRARKLVPLTHCGSCGTTERLHVHHIDRNPANNDPSNLEVLCASCHMKLHWKEDRAKRLAAARKARATVVARYGADSRPRSTDGRWSSVA